MSSIANSPFPASRFILLKKVITLLVALLGIGVILWLDSEFIDHAAIPNLRRDMGYGLLLLVGFLSSFHCVGMCGPLIIGYSAKSAAQGFAAHHAHALYGLGKTLSYTAIGALFGAFGALIAFTPTTQGMVGIAAGVFLLLFGLHMLEVFPALHHFQIHPPRFLMRVVGKAYRQHSNPFVIGLLNGLMIICGPLQAMYIMAAGTGSGTQGALILFFFGLGTLPLLLGFGFLTSVVSKNLTPKLLKASGVIVMALGAIMLNRGLAATGSGMDFHTLTTRLAQSLAPTHLADTTNCEATQTIRMEVSKSGFVPNTFTLRKGVPVRWEIHGNELTFCNKAIIVPQYGLDIPLQPGWQTIEFTPQQAGVVAWSCWMGMIPGTFIVIDDAPAEASTATSWITRLSEEARHTLQTLWQQIAAP